MELALRQMGPMKFERPIAFRLTMSFDACIDGRLPDGVAVMTAAMKDTSPVAGPAGTIEMTFEMAATAKMTIRTVK